MNAANLHKMLSWQIEDSVLCERIGKEILERLEDELYHVFVHDPEKANEDFEDIELSASAADIQDILTQIIINNLKRRIRE